MEKSYSHNTVNDDINLLLLVFTRKFVEQMQYPNYPKEWARPPLSDLTPTILIFLDLHPAKFGTAISKKIKQGQLSSNNGLNYGHLFKPLKQYYLDQYEVGFLQNRKLSYEQINQENTLANTAMKLLQEKLVPSIINTFAALKLSQENEYRTLIRVAKSLHDIIYYLCYNSGSQWPIDALEDFDFFRDMPDGERKAFAEELLNRGHLPSFTIQTKDSTKLL